MITLQPDHIVLAVPNLKDAITIFQEQLGLTPIMGGRHIGFGTHNALLGLGDPDMHSYLELLAIDPEDQTHHNTYPMGLTRDMQEPYVASWCVRRTNEANIEIINNAMKKMGAAYQHGEVRKMQRVTIKNEILSWKIANSQEQVLISNGQVPFLIKWDDLSLHPTTQFSKENLCKYALDFSGTNANSHEENLQQLGLEIPNFLTFTQDVKESIRLSLYYKDKTFTFNGSIEQVNLPILRL